MAAMDEKRQLPRDVVKKGQEVLVRVYGGLLSMIVLLVLSVLLSWVFPELLYGAIVYLLGLVSFYVWWRWPRRRKISHE